MRPDPTDDVAHEISGVIGELDVPGRRLTVLVNGAPMEFDVAPDCTVWLHEDRVKLRLLQPRDYARVDYTDSAEGPVAHAIRVNWWFGESEKPPPPRAPRAADSSGGTGQVRSVG